MWERRITFSLDIRGPEGRLATSSGHEGGEDIFSKDLAAPLAFGIYLTRRVPQEPCDKSPAKFDFSSQQRNKVSTHAYSRCLLKSTTIAELSLLVRPFAREFAQLLRLVPLNDKVLHRPPKRFRQYRDAPTRLRPQTP